MDGGDHACSAGGYTAGNAEAGGRSGSNGLGTTGGSGHIGCGGGYYTKGSTNSNMRSWFSQGGVWYRDSGWFALDKSGSGGDGGAGGEIYYTDINKIHAYNGNRITETNFDYENNNVYEYDKDGNLTEVVANVVVREDGVSIIPARIFAQTGYIRATYQTNQRMTEEECETYGVDFINSESTLDYTKIVNVEITPETRTTPTSYGQGIGSGAGNLEKSNGTFLPISE